ncbi:hypothetical protein [Anabaena sp. CCY 9910]|uniref:hypothetical protein n=1 Tax=Anabaena sp. CCY 9910 TaxID=3103870 RepID=UPI0039E0B8CB
MKINCTDLSSDSGTPWFVCHLNSTHFRKEASKGRYTVTRRYVVTYTAYGTSLLKAKAGVIIKAFFGKPDKND